MEPLLRYGRSVEVWQNERYKPLQGGWLAPFTLPSFSDITARHAIDNDGKGAPTVELEKDYGWTNDWCVDKTGYYHCACDSDGWYYSGSFDSLVRDSLAKTLSGQMKALSLTRRRRWLRKRAPVTPQGVTKCEQFCLWNENVIANTKLVIELQLKEFLAINDFNALRKLAFEDNTTKADNYLAASTSSLSSAKQRLLSLRSYLSERGAVEADYAQRLQGLCERHASSTHSEESSFFRAVGTANISVSRRLLDFSSTLTDSLPCDIDELVQAIDGVIAAIGAVGPSLRASLGAADAQLILAIDAYNGAYEQHKSVKMFIIDRSEKWRGFIVPFSNINHTADAAVSLFDASDASPTTIRSSESAAISSPKTGQSTSSSSAWLLSQAVASKSDMAKAALHIFVAFASQQRRETDALLERAQSVFQSTIKIFASAQSAVWRDSSTLISEISNHFRFLSGKAADAAGERAPSETDLGLWRSVSSDDKVDRDSAGLIEAINDAYDEAVDIAEVPALRMSPVNCNAGLLNYTISNAKGAIVSVWCPCDAVVTLDQYMLIFSLTAQQAEQEALQGGDGVRARELPTHTIDLREVHVSLLLKAVLQFPDGCAFQVVSRRGGAVFTFVAADADSCRLWMNSISCCFSCREVDAPEQSDIDYSSVDSAIRASGSAKIRTIDS